MEMQTRSFPMKDFHTRDENGNLFIEGYFSVFNSRYNVFDGGFETVSPGAFSETLGGDIRALINHDSTLVLGRTTAGTLELREDEIGLWGRITINPNDRDAVNLYERVRRGDVSQCSFGFDIIEQSTEELPDGTIHWTLVRVKLYEVSVVTFPAYQDTAVVARTRDAEAFRTEKWRSKMLAKLKGADKNGTSRSDAE